MKIIIEISKDKKLWSVTTEGLPGEPEGVIRHEDPSPRAGNDGIAKAFMEASWAATAHVLRVLRENK